MRLYLGTIPGLLIFVLLVSFALMVFVNNNQLKDKLESYENSKNEQIQNFENLTQELSNLKNRDEYLINEENSQTIDSINKTYTKSVSVYENLLKLKEKSDKTDAFDDLYARAVTELSKESYATAEAILNDLDNKVKEETEKVEEVLFLQSQKINAPENNSPPGSGYSRQYVNCDVGKFLVSMIAADVSNTKVIVDTASDSDCGNECPVLSLSDFVTRNQAYAGVNGSYFCPASYPSCAGKTNSFDLLVMNHKKTYFNSGNNVYSSNPAVIFGDGYLRFVAQASEWGRDTSPNGVLSNYPLLLMGGEIRFGGDDDPKKGSKGNRSYVANKGNNVYIGVVHSATVAESARVMKALGFENALNLDNGGSTALWSSGYKLGPGRNIPNAILFVRK